MNPFIIIAETNLNESLMGPIIGLICVLVVVWFVYIQPEIPTQTNKRNWANEKFKDDFRTFYTATEFEAVVLWLNDCSAIIKKGDKEFVRVFKNDEGLFAEEPYPVFAEQSVPQA